jgi:O-antigen ligase
VIFLRLLAAAGCALFLLPVAGAWTLDGNPLAVRLLSTALLLAGFARPRWGLFALAFLLPLSPYLHAQLGPPALPSALAEMCLASFLLGASVRTLTGTSFTPGTPGSPGSPGSPGTAYLFGPAVVLGALVAVSGALKLAERQRVTTWPLEFLLSFRDHLRFSYFSESFDFQAFHMAVMWIEALALAVFAERVVRADRRRWVPVLIAAGTAVAATGWMRLAQISLRRDEPLAAAVGFLRTERINTLFTDANAAGSLFVLFLVLAAWLALQRTLEAHRAGTWRYWNWYWLAAIGIALPLWMTKSRAAFAGGLVALGAVWLASYRPSRKVVAAGAVAVAALFVALVLLNPGSRQQSSSALSMGIRWEMGKVALRITEQQPVFGVGLGEFRPASLSFITPELQELFPATRVGENAHNNFLQILAELGIVGLATFLWLLVAAARSLSSGAVGSGFGRTSSSGLGRTTSDTAQLGLAGGILAFLICCLAGHPFLTAQVLWVFCLTLGTMAGLGAAPAPAASAARVGRLAAALTALVLVSAPVRFWQARQTDLGRTTLGAGPITTEDSDIPYRRAGARSAHFVPGDVRFVQIPLRVTRDSQSPCAVQLELDGAAANVVEVTSGEWRRVPMQLPPQPTSQARRIEIRVDRADCRLMIGEITSR